MKKKATVLIASIMAFCGINTAHADEGMWTIYNLPNAVYEMMQREGFSMTYDQLYNGENALKNAVVNFSGYCSGVVVSPDGLVFTNHHCGFEAIRSHSTVEHDYMLNEKRHRKTSNSLCLSSKISWRHIISLSFR